MDTKHIINNIWDSFVLDPISNKMENVVIIDVKATVFSFKYEIYSDKGYCLVSSYQKKIGFGAVSDYDNRLILHVRGDQSDTLYFIKLSEVKVIKPTNPRFGIDHSPETIEINEPIFYFHQIKTHKEIKPDSHVDVIISDADELPGENENEIDSKEKK